MSGQYWVMSTKNWTVASSTDLNDSVFCWSASVVVFVSPVKSSIEVVFESAIISLAFFACTKVALVFEHRILTWVSFWCLELVLATFAIFLCCFFYLLGLDSPRHCLRVTKKLGRYLSSGLVHYYHKTLFPPLVRLPHCFQKEPHRGSLTAPAHNSFLETLYYLVSYW